jgi:hypothetical protein
MLVVGRAVAGMGGAGLVNGALTILSTCVPLEKRAREFPCVGKPDGVRVSEISLLTVV